MNPAGMSRCSIWSTRKGSSESHRIVIREASVSNLHVHNGKAMGKYQVQDMTMNVRLNKIVKRPIAEFCLLHPNVRPLTLVLALSAMKVSNMKQI